MTFQRTASSGRTSTNRWRRIRLQVLASSGGICAICGRPGADEVHHIVAVSRGGTDDLGNLQAVHERPCHRSHTAREANAIRWANTPRTGRPPEPHPGIRHAP